jgi:hypothetical protein
VEPAVQSIPFTQWSVEDWVAHYAPHAAAGAFWDHQARRPPTGGHHHGPRAYYAGQQPPAAVRSVAQHGAQALQSTVHNTTSLVRHGIDKATSPGVLIAGVAVLGILGWVLIEQSKTVSRTVESVAPHAAKALPLLAL